MQLARVLRSAPKWLLRAFAAFALALPLPLAGQQSVDAATQGRRIALIRELTIGTNPGGPEYEFAGIWFAAMTGSGGVFVSDGAEALIRRYDRLGRFRGAVGRSGSGPGEYRRIEGMALVGDSLLIVYDRGNGRVVVFDTAGDYRRSFPVIGGGFHPYKALAAFSDGTIALRARTSEGWRGGAAGVPSVFIRYRLNGEVVDSVRAPPEDMAGMVLGGGTLGFRWAFPATTVFTLLPRGGIGTAHTTTYRIDVAPARGPGFVIERAVRPIPLDGREREEWQALLRLVAARAPGFPTPALPRHKPFFRDLFADAEGRIWVNVYTQATPSRLFASRASAERTPSLTMWEHNAYDVFDERGRYLGRVDLPPSSRLLDVRGSRAWVGEETEEGEILLVRYELRMPPVP